MTERTFEVIGGGLMTTVQDRGRLGYYDVGIPPGGSLDQYSAEIANALVGNDGGDAVLESTFTGPTLVARDDIDIAVTGAPVAVSINGQPRDTWSRLSLRAGDRLSFGLISGGTRFYIAFSGGIDVPLVLGSRSTYTRGALGGFQGRKLEPGDVVPVGPRRSPPPRETITAEHRPLFDREQTVRVMLGLYDHRLTDEGLVNMTRGTWTLTPVSDRAGLRYDGPGVTWRERAQPFGAGSGFSNIVDACYAVGSILIPGPQPIVLHRDAVSGGGYAMVATVISADMDLVARAVPGTRTRFEPVDLETALRARQERSVAMSAAVTSLSA